MTDERWSGIESQRDPYRVYAWLGTVKDGTFQGTIRLDLDGGVAHLSEVKVEDGVDGAELAAALFGSAIQHACDVTRVQVLPLGGSEDDRLLASLRSRYPDIEFATAR